MASHLLPGTIGTKQPVRTRASWYFVMLLALFRFIVRASSGLTRADATQSNIQARIR